MKSVKNPRKWLGLAALIPGLAMSFMDQTIVPVALPTIQRELGASNVALQWSVNSYLLVTAMFVLAGGKLSDRIGHRRTYMWGMVVFAVASALCGLSLNIENLIGARALQGIGAAMMFPSQSALLPTLFAPHERGRANGINVSVSSLFLMLGPLVGGYLTEVLSWRSIFWVNLPIAGAGLVLARLFLPISVPGHQKIDLRGFTYFALACAGVVVFFMQGSEWGWSSLKTIGCILVALAMIVMLVFRERRAAHPFLDLTLFKHPTYAAINVSIGITQFILMIAVFWAIYFQTVLGYPPNQSGALIFLSCVPVLFCSPIGGFLSDKIGPKFPIAAGFLFLIYACFWFAFFSTPGLVSLVIAILAFGFGVPLILTPSYTAAMSAIPPTKMGIGFGTISTLRNLAATMGIALIGLFMNSVQDSKLQKLIITNPETSHLSSPQVLEISNRTLSIEAAVGSSETREFLTQSLRQAEITSFSGIHFVLAFLLILSLAAALVLHNRKSGHHLPKSPAEGWD